MSRMRAMTIAILSATSAVVLSMAAAPAADGPALETGFAHPPAQTKPWCYWYWISDNISREGITRDLEAMARVGIGEALIGNIFLGEPAGKTKVLSEEWWQLVEHAIREGGRTGVDIGMFNCPGWSQSGGPWVKPEQAMRYLVSSETRVSGPARFAAKLPTPKEPFQDVAVLAFPAPLADADAIATHAPRVTSAPAVAGAERWFDGDPASAAAVPGHTVTIDLAMDAPFTARSLLVHPTGGPFQATCTVQAPDPDGTWRTIAVCNVKRENPSVNVGPMPFGPASVSFAAVTSRSFRLVIAGARGAGQLAELELTGAARLDAFVEKQLGKMFQQPLPLWDAYLWPTPDEPDSPALAVDPAAVSNLTGRMTADGTLRWDVPAGEWVIVRTGMTPTGTRNSPASPEGQGLEIDKMNRRIAAAHFDAFIGQVLERMPAADRKAFKQVVADSYEMGSENWSDDFAAAFRQRYGYDPLPWLPVLTGRLVGGADRSERFLWDLRRLVADRVATEYVGGLRDKCRENGLGLWLENYGHWGFPSEFLMYGSRSDRIGGEFWVTGSLGSIECRAASSCANTYGKPFVSAEAFTGGPAFRNAPAALKARGDWAFCEGINHFVLHVYIQQPWEDRVPGVNAWFGTEFNRHNTWFEQGRAWIDYVRRCCWLLQQGSRVADVAYFIGEDAPKMTGERKPELPVGYDFDYINAEVIETRLGVENGLLTIPDGPRYRVLVLPEQNTMRPELARKIAALVKAGATVMGPRPERSPSLRNYPACDAELRALARRAWDGDAATGGRVLDGGASLAALLADRAGGPDFSSDIPLRYTHRRTEGADIYFVANPKAADVQATAAFRVGDKAPELWWPDSGRIERPAIYDAGDGTVRVPLALGPNGSVFVVFRDPAAPDRIVAVTRNGQPLLNTAAPRAEAAEPPRPSAFSMAVWLRPTDGTTLHAETTRGVRGLGEKRNDVIFPMHGGTFDPAGGHAGSGLAVGTNGICVFEHGPSYFVPICVHAMTITNWAHLAVVYSDGQPTLYVNGAKVHVGLKSEKVVHPSPDDTQGGGPFRGELGPVERYTRALSPADVAELARTMPRPDSTPGGPALALERSADGTVTGCAWRPGQFRLKHADGRDETIAIPPILEPLKLDGPWDVTFDLRWGGPERVTFERLCDWTSRPEEGIRHYSGKATYRRTFELADVGAPRFLDLGEVRDLAVVRLNGKPLGTLWQAPWRVDITSAVVKGENRLEVDVIDAWNNRLVGDAQRPAEQRVTFITAPTVKANTPLQPAGLLGPVRVLTAERVAVSAR